MDKGDLININKFIAYFLGQFLFEDLKFQLSFILLLFMLIYTISFKHIFKIGLYANISLILFIIFCINFLFLILNRTKIHAGP